MFQIGKTGIGYLLSLAKLGHINNGTFSDHVCGGVFGATAYADPVVYVPCVDGLRAVTIGPGASFRVKWSGPAGEPGPPIVGDGSVWYLDSSSGEGQLVGLSPATGKANFRVTVGSMVHFASPAAGDGLILVAAGGRIEALGA